MVVEAFRTMKLAYIALNLSSLPPDIFFDTTGCAFTYIVANILFCCKVIAYVHYPTISTDMLSLVWDRRRVTYNNQQSITNSRLKTYVKLIYYTIYAIIYGMVGSLWTYNHIQSLWLLASYRKCIHVVYPPCRMKPSSKEDPAEKKTR